MRIAAKIAKASAAVKISNKAVPNCFRPNACAARTNGSQRNAVNPSASKNIAIMSDTPLGESRLAVIIPPSYQCGERSENWNV